MVGSIQVPMGVAGPVSVDGGGSVAGEKYLPATTEGALLASVNRGCSVINSAGGATARVLKSGMTRAPVFRVADVAEAEALVSWTRDNFAALKEAAEETTNHGELLDVTPYVVGNSVYLRFRYDTKDAMGMNMATIATEAVCGGVVEAETAACLSPSRATSVPTRSPPPSTPSRARPERHRRRSNPARGRRRTPAHHARSGRGTQHTQEPGRFREGREPRVQRPRRQRRRRDVPRHRAGRGAGRRGRERHHDRRGAGRRPLRLGLHRLPRVGTVGGGTKLPTQSEGLDILGVSGGGDPAGSNADALAECIAVGSPRANSPSPRSPRGTSPAPTPNSGSVTAWGLLSDRDS